VIAVKPMPKPGWSIELTKGPYARSYAFYHGNKFSEGVRQVTWRGGPLPDEYFDEFVLSTFIAAELQPGTKLTFPVSQRCQTGEILWHQVAKEGEDPHALDFPAPRLMLVAGSNEHAHHAQHSNNAVQAGDLSLEAPWTRATPKGATAAAGYLKITNQGAAPDVLLGASTDQAERAELHETATNDKGVSTMRHLPAGVTIDPGAAVELKPLGTHIILTGLKAPLEAGQTLNLQLRFKRAGIVSVPFEVKPIGTMGAHTHAH
jgi:periplasmic copper chaperone A